MNPSINYKDLLTDAFHHMLKLTQTLCYRSTKANTMSLYLGAEDFLNRLFFPKQF